MTQQEQRQTQDLIDAIKKGTDTLAALPLDRLSDRIDAAVTALDDSKPDDKAIAPEPPPPGRAEFDEQSERLKETEDTILLRELRDRLDTIITILSRSQQVQQ